MTQTTTKYKRKPWFNIYKPLKKEGAGAALQFSYDATKLGIYLEASRQKGGKLAIGSKDQFDWANKIVFKLGTADVGQLLLLFAGRKKEIKLIHQPRDGAHTSVLEITKQTGQYDNYSLKLSKTVKGNDGNTTNGVNIYVDHHEMALLAHFMRESLTRMFGFDAPEPQEQQES